MIARNTGGPPLTEAGLRPLEQVAGRWARLEVTTNCRVDSNASETAGPWPTGWPGCC